jgi:hypothetical protein
MLRTGICILVIFSFLCRETSGVSILKSNTSRFDLKLSSNSSIIYPGISAGIEFPCRPAKYDVPVIKRNSRSFNKSRFIAGNLSWYHHPDLHDNIYLTTEWVMRRTRPGGFTCEVSFGPGFSRTFIAATTYKVNDNGDISIVKLAGYNYAVITVGGGMGYDFLLKKQIPVTVFSKMNLLSMFPFNSTVYIRPVLELGFRYSAGLKNQSGK